MNDFDFYWNYRIVNTKTANGGEDWDAVAVQQLREWRV